MFTLLSGELVHVAESSSEHLVKAATLHARSVARVLPGVPANVETLVGRALRFEKKERWTSATEMRQELWRVRLDPGRPVGTTSTPPPRLPSSEFPTVIGRRDSDKSGLRETGMSLTGEPHPSEYGSRRAVFVSTVVAVLLIASAMSFGIWTFAHESARPRPAAAAPDPGPPPLLPPSLDTPDSALSAFGGAADLAKPATTGVPAPATGTGAVPPAATTAKGGVPAPKPSAKRAAPPTAPSADLYKPF